MLGKIDELCAQRDLLRKTHTGPLKGRVGAPHTGAAPIIDHPPSPLFANAQIADFLMLTTTARAAVNSAEIATSIAAVVTTNTTADPDEPKQIAEAALADPPLLQRPLQVASASAFEPLPREANKAVDSLETPDACSVADTCIDQYLWALYQRAPKEGAIRISEQRRVTVKRKGKLRTVTKTFTRLVDEDFAWKDLKAAEKVRMPMMNYVIGGMDRSFKAKLFQVLRAAEAAGLSPGITSAFRDDYRQSIASGLKAANDRSYHGGSFRGGYGHGVAADLVSIEGETRDQRYRSSEKLWSWIDAHGQEFGVGRPYLNRDPPHVAPIDGNEFAAHRRGVKTQHAGSDVKERNRLVAR